MKPTFNNRLNDVYYVGEKQLWISRSIAVVGVLFALVNEELFILAEKRSDIMADEPGKWCLPCGYLDWDENGWDALRREVYEETSFLIDDYKRFLKFNNNLQPFFVNTSPSENRQNVALSYALLFDFPLGGLPEHIQDHQDSEVSEIKWIPYTEKNEYTWAFKHNERINMGIEEILKSE